MLMRSLRSRSRETVLLHTRRMHCRSGSEHVKGRVDYVLELCSGKMLRHCTILHTNTKIVVGAKPRVYILDAGKKRRPL